MQQKNVMIVLKTGESIGTQGHLSHDPVEGTLTILGEVSNAVFNWDHVAYFLESNAEDD